MGKCKNHPQVETAYYCAKQQHYLCGECLKCSDPDLYCKYRPSCVIHFLEKEKKLEEKAAVTIEKQ